MDSGAYAWTTTDDPIEVLLGEHRTILMVLDEVDRERARLDGDGLLREPFWRDVLHFVDEFDGNLHHQKEEQLLFPALEASGLSPTHGPTAVLRDEHRRSMFWRQRLEQALVARDRLRVGSTAASWVDLLRAHVLKENQILFPLARKLLTADQLERLHREFRPYAADQRLRYWLKSPYVLSSDG
jgi:hemerythrin-like domain-containing protein